MSGALGIRAIVPLSGSVHGRECMEEGLSPGPGASPSGHLVYSLNLGFCYDQLTDLGKLPASLSCPSTVGTFSLGHGPHPAFPGRTLPASPCSGGPACLHLTQHALPLVHMRHCWLVCVVVVGVFFLGGGGVGGLTDWGSLFVCCIVPFVLKGTPRADEQSPLVPACMWGPCGLGAGWGPGLWYFSSVALGSHPYVCCSNPINPGSTHTQVPHPLVICPRPMCSPKPTIFEKKRIATSRPVLSASEFIAPPSGCPWVCHTQVFSSPVPGAPSSVPSNTGISNLSECPHPAPGERAWAASWQVPSHRSYLSSHLAENTQATCLDKVKAEPWGPGGAPENMWALSLGCWEPPAPCGGAIYTTLYIFSTYIHTHI